MPYYRETIKKLLGINRSNIHFNREGRISMKEEYDARITFQMLFLVLTCAIVLGLATTVSAVQAHDLFTDDKLPEKGQNNLWYSVTDSNTVIIFVHGIFSDSRTAWLNEDSRAYWPKLIKTDPQSDFNRSSIYLAGFYTKVDSGLYGIRNAADEIFSALRNQDNKGNFPPIEKANMLFVTHSTGGVVVRYMLERYSGAFADKNIGLILIASPSWGSKISNYLDPLSRLYSQRMGQELKWGSWELEDLDARFRSLIDEKRIPNMIGEEMTEGHFVIHRKLFPLLSDDFVVPFESANRYFEARKLGGLDHFEAVKPKDRDHLGYIYVKDFYNKKFLPLIRSAGVRIQTGYYGDWNADRKTSIKKETVKIITRGDDKISWESQGTTAEDEGKKWPATGFDSGDRISLSYITGTPTNKSVGYYFLKKKDGAYSGTWTGLSSSRPNVMIVCPYVLSEENVSEKEARKKWPILTHDCVPYSDN